MQFKPDPQRPDFTVRRYSGNRPTPPVISKEEQLLADKISMQKNVKDLLGIDKIPSPTNRPTKSLTDQATGFLFSDKKKLRPNQERDPEEEVNVVLD
jgi:hypothetical protein